ncbi:MAG: hypothetical protein HYR75_06465 [Gemmatimonadetes bacterium]|nr:hypothetical protein [Gemmatimonadota bacterium]MBI3568409.1 hypothetical protein [Gemmatimonadota bacterium]
MFGCIGRLGCLLVLAIAGAIGWYTHDAWWPKVRGYVTSTPPAATAVSQWEPLTAAGAEKARTTVAQLSQRNGPVYVNVAAGDLAAFVLDSVLHGFSPAATDAKAMARDERLYLRAQVSVADLGGPKTLGPLSGMVSGKQELTVGGRLEVLKPGRAQYVVDEILIGELKLPAAAIPKLVGRIGVSARDTSVSPAAIPLHVPRELGDVRISKGKVTLYKVVP